MENIEQGLINLILSQSMLTDPIKYNKIISISKDAAIEELRLNLPEIKKRLESLEILNKQAQDLKKFFAADDYAKRRKSMKNNAFQSLDQQQDLPRQQVDITMLIATNFESIYQIYLNLQQGAELLCNSKMVTLTKSDIYQKALAEDNYSSIFMPSEEDIRIIANEQKVNQGAQTSFLQGLAILEKIPKMFEIYLQSMIRGYEYYYERLRSRHREGVVIAHINNMPAVALTDMAIMIWENIDKMGEIDSGSSKDEISAYTIHRAYAILEAAKNPLIWQWMINPESQLLEWMNRIKDTMFAVLEIVKKIKMRLGDSLYFINNIDLNKFIREFSDILSSLTLSQITQKSPERAFSKTERFALEHQNKSILNVVDLLLKEADLNEIASEIIKMKIEERKFFMYANSFYVTKIGTGNIFTGDAPGELEVIPGERPHANLDYIWGSGFPEMKDFISGMDSARKWQPLFLATSPSKSTDKTSILLVSPPGSGKTELMRAVASQGGNISIFAVGSSFLTPWLGQSQNNPKKLFDAAIKLHKSSGWPVFILIDEIDAVLNNDRSTGNINLSTEFQNLMDGVVAYPGLSIIGATNFPDRIPAAMVRRFAKVMIVGELSDSDRISILRHYLLDYLPCENFSDDDFSRWSSKLEGSVGDVIRKSVDNIWLDFMRVFIKEKETEALKILDYLKDQYGDKFDISMLSNEDRLKIKQMIVDSGHIVTVKMVDDKIDQLLANIAIQQQIQTAKTTYRQSKQLLEKQLNGFKGLGY